MTGNDKSTVGLISMPWMASRLPSIQLATLGAALEQEGIGAESHELFLDYAATIGLSLYDKLSDAGGFIEEFIFSQCYFGRETGTELSGFGEHRPPFGVGSQELEDQVLEAVHLTSEGFLDRMAREVDWSRYDVIGFSLTISQTAASMALAREIKLRFPHIPIVFGGSSCAGPMGPALLRTCPYVDAVVRVEGETAFPKLVRRLRDQSSVADLDGISYRAEDGSVLSTPNGPLYERKYQRRPLNYDAYFERLDRLGLRDRIDIWLPFESSRGCWYGQKKQCTFCGLHEIMKYRDWDWQSVLSDLEWWAERYGVTQFFSVDLIMPMSYYNTLLPEIERRGHDDWTLFYEIKANVKPSHVETLAAGGVKWIQPGIESLSTEVLRLMDKGTTAAQNLQLLKWCKEHDVRVTWNIISGIPLEDPAVYPQMAQLMRRLYHLIPPSGASAFQLHRFSPYFDQPEKFGLKPRGAHPLYRYCFPIPQPDLDDLVYHYGYDIDRPAPLEEYTRPVLEAIAEWQQAYRRGARLSLEVAADGTATLVDTRWSQEPATYRLTPASTALYLYLDEARPEHTLWTRFAAQDPAAAAALEAHGAGLSVLQEWEDQGLIVKVDGLVLALAVDAGKVEPYRSHGREDELVAPVPYLSVEA